MEEPTKINEHLKGYGDTVHTWTKADAQRSWTKRKRSGIQISLEGLYFFTFLIELFGGLFRTIVALLFWLFVVVPVALLLLLLTPRDMTWLINSAGTLVIIALVLAVVWGAWPLVFSLITLLNPVAGGDGGETKAALGAREATREELAKISETIQEIQTQANRVVTAPNIWLVIDTPIPNGYTVGNMIFLTRELVHSEFLKAGIAHELGHIQGEDGITLLALRRLIIPLAYLIGIDRRPQASGIIAGSGPVQQTVHREDERLYFRIKAMRLRFRLALFWGGLGLLSLAPLWGTYWRDRDFEADACVATWGLADELIRYLEQYQAFDLAHPFLLAGRAYSAERIDRLRG